MALLEGNSNDIVIERLRVRKTGLPIEDAVINVTITDTVNESVIDEITLAHDGDGTYSYPSEVQYTAGIQYKIDAVAESPYVFRRILYEVCQEPEI